MLDYHSLQVLNLAYFVMYLTLDILFVRHREGLLFDQEKKQMIPLLGSLPEYRTIYPLFCSLSMYSAQDPGVFFLCFSLEIFLDPAPWQQHPLSARSWEDEPWNIFISGNLSEGSGHRHSNRLCRIRTY